WKSNKEGDFSYAVDNTLIFEFIEDIRSNEKLWIFEFDKAQDITSVLKTQLSNLFKESLKIRTKFESENSELYKSNLSNSAMSILLRKDEFYEFEFFAQTLVDEISKKENFKNDYQYNIHIESQHKIDDKNQLL